MKKCCKRTIKFHDLKKPYTKCPKCKHVYHDGYPRYTVLCKCEKMPLKKLKYTL